LSRRAECTAGKSGATISHRSLRAPEHGDLGSVANSLTCTCNQASAGSNLQSVWIGSTFHESLSNSRPRSEREAEYEIFLRKSDAEFQKLDETSFGYFERLGRTEDRKGFAKALQHAGADIESPSSVLLIPHKESFEGRTGNRLAWTLGSFGMGITAWFALVLLRGLDDERAKRWLDPDRSARKDASKTMLALFIPSRQAYGLPILVSANTLVFVAMVMAGLGLVSFDADDLIR
jgi:hypothetical protein